MRCRHVGDLGNVEVVDGVVDTIIHDWLVTLFGNQSVIGYSMVVSILGSFILRRMSVLMSLSHKPTSFTLRAHPRFDADL